MTFGAVISAYVFLCSAVLTAVFIFPYRWWALRIGMLAVPNARSAHSLPTPSGAGVIMVFVSLMIFAYLTTEEIIGTSLWWLVWPGALITAAIGFIDDRYPLSAKYRAIVHLIAGVIFVAAIPDLAIWMLPLLTVVVAWSLNLFNFMDGADGLAGSESVYVLGIGGFFCWYGGEQNLAILAWILAGSSLGFLAWNRPKAKIFMGDVGSGFLGYMIAAIAILSVIRGGISPLVWLILYGFFWFDTSLTLIRRVWRGEKWYLAHRSHAYQRLLHAGGFSHRRLLGCSLALNAILAGLAVWGFWFPARLPVAFSISLGLLAGIYYFIERRYPIQPDIP